MSALTEVGSVRKKIENMDKHRMPIIVNVKIFLIFLFPSTIYLLKGSISHFLTSDYRRKFHLFSRALGPFVLCVVCDVCVQERKKRRRGNNRRK
jgi:hypothetical protein